MTTTCHPPALSSRLMQRLRHMPWLRSIILASLFLGVFAWGVGAGSGRVFPYSQLVAAHDLLRFGPSADELDTSLRAPQLSDLQGGGFIFHIRHAEREGSPDDIILMDLFELSTNEVLSLATCLSDVGRHQAALTGWIFEYLGIPSNVIVSTPLCRAKQHAEIAFGRIDAIDARHLYAELIAESETDVFVNAQSAAYTELATHLWGSNAVIIGHSFEPANCLTVQCLSGGRREQGGVSIITALEGEFVEVARFSTLTAFFSHYRSPGLIN